MNSFAFSTPPDAFITIDHSKIINLTNCVVNIFNAHPPYGSEIHEAKPNYSFEPTYPPAFADRKYVFDSMIVVVDEKGEKHDILASHLQRTTNLPPPRPGHIYIVDEDIAYIFSDRTDLYVPGSQVYDKFGNIVGYVGLSHVFKYN